MEFLDQVISFSISYHIIWGIVCFIFASFFRFVSVANFALAGRMFTGVNPPVYGPPPPPPIVIVFLGVRGCFAGIVTRILSWLLFVEGIDQILLTGAVTQWIINHMPLQF